MERGLVPVGSHAVVLTIRTEYKKCSSKNRFDQLPNAPPLDRKRLLSRQVCRGARDPGDTGQPFAQPTLLTNVPRLQPHVHEHAARIQGYVGRLLFRGVGLDAADTAAGERVQSRRAPHTAVP